jgi:hypothetical protein
MSERLATALAAGSRRRERATGAGPATGEAQR